jgi:hypothetical protein
MSTALTLINDALSDLQVKSSEVDLTDNEIAQGVRYLNRLMVSLAAQGLSVPFKRVTNATDETNIPDFYEELIVTYLAIRLAPSFGIEQINPGLIAAAQNAMNAVTHRIVRIPQSSYPDTLPIGSGNEMYDNGRFFTVDVNQIQTDFGNNLDDNTGLTLTE